MKHLSDILAATVLVLFITGTALAIEQMIGHPARYVEQTTATDAS